MSKEKLNKTNTDLINALIQCQNEIADRLESQGQKFIHSVPDDVSENWRKSSNRFLMIGLQMQEQGI